MAIAEELEPVLRRAAPLTPYAWRFRYPGDVDEDLGPGEAKAALAAAGEVYEAVLAILPPDVRP